MARDRAPGPRLGSEVLAKTRKGMAVYDVHGQMLGSVRSVFLGESSEAARGRGTSPATASRVDPRQRGLLDDFLAVFAHDPVPEELRERLRLHGFARIDCTGLLAPDRYVMPEQIESVGEDRVTLGVSADELIKR